MCIWKGSNLYTYYFTWLDFICEGRGGSTKKKDACDKEYLYAQQPWFIVRKCPLCTHKRGKEYLELLTMSVADFNVLGNYK